MKTITKLWNKIPLAAQSAIRHLVITFAVVFVAAAKPLLAGLWSVPDLKTAKALLVAAILGAGAAAVRVVVPLLVGYAKSLVDWFAVKYL
jgi:UDP-N-acetylglucosamine enolpyruvyl transferase